MAELLGLGLSHYPPLITPDRRMAFILKHMLSNPRLPAPLRDSANWPAGMRAEWAEDEGAAAAAQHREKLVTWMRRVREALDEFKPDFILMWGDDQYENFQEDVIPPYCVSAYDTIEYGVPADNVWGEPSDKTFSVPGAPGPAKYLLSRLIEEGFDAAYAYKPLHHKLGHAFSNAIHYLDYDRKGFPYPVIPVAVNCYGSRVICQKGGFPRFDVELNPEDLDPPAPTPRRLFDLGAATARILRDSPYRVALISSSSWSHAFLTEKNHYLYPDTEADRRLFDALRTGDYQAWRNYPAAAIDDSGQQEVLNWMCLAGALHELNRVPTEAGFVDTWIFNSSKAFVVAPPT